MRVTALFDSRTEAESVVNELRSSGFRDEDFSIVSRHGDEVVTDDGKEAVSGAGKGLAAGAGVGALFGIAAALIPGVGPFITAGALATALGSSVVGGAAAGAIVGGAVGSLAGAFARAGYGPEESQYYGHGVEEGGVLVAVETQNATTEAKAREVFARHSGRMYATSQTA
jgi:hypothetical protein